MIAIERLEDRQLFSVTAPLTPVTTGVLEPAALSEGPAQSPTALAGTLYDSGGFESPRFTPGNLHNQDAAQGAWLQSGNATAVVQTAVKAGGNQAVRLDRLPNQDGRFGPAHTVSAVNSVITVSWAMRVESAAAGAQDFGPFFGVEAYYDDGQGTLLLMGSAGVDAKTGEILFQHAGTGFLDTTGVTLSLGAFHTFRLVLDYSTQMYSYYADNTLVHTEGFVDSTPANPITGFTIASISTFASGGEPASLAATGTAYFDDYSISSAAVVAPPQVSTFGVDDGSAQRSQVRSATVKFDRPVTLAAGAFSLARLNTGGSGANDNSAPTDASAVLGTPTSSDGGTTWVVPFTGTASAFAEKGPGGTPTGSLVDGIYTLTVDPTKVTAGGVAMAAPASTTFHRLFGDLDGNKTVSTLDYGNFRNSFGKGTGQAGFNPSFDFDGNGVVNTFDYGQFRLRYAKLFAY